MKHVNRISFVIPSYNSHTTIHKCILSIISQTQIEKIIEILIVDSSEDQNIQSRIDSIGHEKVKVLQLTEKTMPARSRNIGAQHAKGDILCFIDSDTYLEPDWLEIILVQFKKGKLVGGGAIFYSGTSKR